MTLGNPTKLTALAFVLTLLAVSAPALLSPVHAVTEAQQAKMKAMNALDGRTFDYEVAGYRIRVEFLAEDKLRWTYLEAPDGQQGKTAEEVRRFFADSRARDLAAHFESLRGGESFRHFHERVSSGLEGLLLDGHRFQIHLDAGHRLWRMPEQRRRLLIVAHEGTNAILLSHLLGLEPLPWTWLHFSSAWASITSLHLTPVASGAVWALEGFNRVQHLEGLESESDGRTYRA